MLVGRDPGQHFALCVVVFEGHTELPVQAGLERAVGAAQDVGGVYGGVHQLGDLVAAEGCGAGGGEAGGGGVAAGFGVGDPGGDGGGVGGTGVDEAAVARELAVALLDDGPDLFGRVGGGVAPGGVEAVDGGRAVARGELEADSLVQGGDQVAFAQEDVARVVDLVGVGVGVRVAAAVVGLGADGVAGHFALAALAGEASGQDVDVVGACASGFTRRREAHQRLTAH